MCDNKIITKAKRVENSLTIAIPSEESEAQQINEGDVVQIDIQRRVNINDLLVTVKFSKSSQEMKDGDRRM